MSDSPFLQIISLSQKEQLNKMLKAYLNELAIITDSDINPEYEYLDSYFEINNRKAFFIIYNITVTGFCMLNDSCVLEENEMSIAEFYIIKEYRNKGIAKKAVLELMKNSKKNWEIRTHESNINALGFWEKTIQNLVKDNYKRQKKDDEVIFSLKH